MKLSYFYKECFFVFLLLLVVVYQNHTDTLSYVNYISTKLIKTHPVTR